MKNAVLMLIFVFIIFYLGGCFAFASFDIKEWDSFGRGFIALFGILFSFITFGATLSFQAKK